MGPGIKACVFLLLLGVSTFDAVSQSILIVTENWEPYAGENLEDHRILVDLVRHIFADSSYSVTVKFYPWARALSMAKNGEADCLLGAFYSIERAVFLDYPKPLLSQETALFTLKDSRFSFTSYADLKRYRVGRVRNAINGAEFDSQIEPVAHNLVDLHQCITLLLIHRIDAFAGPVVNVEHLLDTVFYEDKARVLRINPPIEEQNIYCAVAKKSPYNVDLRRILSNRIDELKIDGTYDRLLQKHSFTQN